MRIDEAPGAQPHHSSIIQSLYALRTPTRGARLLASMKTPQKRVIVGKHSEAKYPGPVHVVQPRFGV